MTSKDKPNHLIDMHTHDWTCRLSDHTIVDIPLNEWNEKRLSSLPKAFSISMHPYNHSIDQLDILQKWIETNRDNRNWIAIGEIGFDPKSPLSNELQLAHFKASSLLAKREQKPIIVHCVKRYDLLRTAYDSIKPDQAWILHGFRKNAETMMQWKLPNIYFSLGMQMSKELAEEIPLDRLFLESDDHSCATIEQVYNQFSILRAINKIELVEQIKKNYKTITHKRSNNEFC